MAFDRDDEAEDGHDDCDDGQPLQAGAPETVSYVVMSTARRVRSPVA